MYVVFKYSTKLSSKKRSMNADKISEVSVYQRIAMSLFLCLLIMI